METTMNKKKLIIDTDPGHDDALAILLMCAAPNIEISAVTTVAGNSTIQNVTNNAKHILTLAGHENYPYFLVPINHCYANRCSQMCMGLAA